MTFIEIEMLMSKIISKQISPNEKYSHLVDFNINQLFCCENIYLFSIIKLCTRHTLLKNRLFFPNICLITYSVRVYGALTSPPLPLYIMQYAMHYVSWGHPAVGLILFIQTTSQWLMFLLCEEEKAGPILAT